MSSAHLQQKCSRNAPVKVQQCNPLYMQVMKNLHAASASKRKQELSMLPTISVVLNKIIYS